MKKLLPLLWFCIFSQLLSIFNLSAETQNQEVNQLYNSSTRSVIDLSGKWKLISSNGEESEIELPSKKNIVGKFTYEREIIYPFSNSKNYILDLQGLNYNCDIFINDKFIAATEGYYSNSKIQIPQNILIADKPNLIKIFISNTFNENTTPHKNLYLSVKNFNGITKSISIIETPLVWIEYPSISITQQLKEKVLLKMKIPINKNKIVQKENGKLNVEISDTSTSTFIYKNSFNFELNENEIEFQTSLDDIKLWNTNSPTTYKFSLKIQSTEDTLKLEDEINYQFGLKDFKISKNNFLLNNQPIIIKGINYNQLSKNSDFGISNNELRNDIKWIKEAGFNTILTEYIQPSIELLKLCDEFGLLVFYNLPITDYPSFYSSKKMENGLERIILQNINQNNLQSYISLLIIGPGIKITNSLSNKIEELSNQINKNIVVQLNRNQKNNFNNIFNFINYSKKDTIGLEEELANFKNYNDSPILISGIGFPANWNNHLGYLYRYSEEFQAKNLQDILAKISKSNYSFIINNFADYEIENSTTNAPLGKLNYNLNGILTADRKEKMGAQIVKNILLKNQKINLFQGSASEYSTLFFTILSIASLIIVSWLLSVNRKIFNHFNRSLFHLKNYLDDVVSGTYISLPHSIIVLIILSLPVALMISSLVSFVNESELFDRFYNIVVSDLESMNYQISSFKSPLKLFLITWIKIIILSLIPLFGIYLIYKILGTRFQLVKIFMINNWIRTPLIYLFLVAMFIPRLYTSSTFITITLIIFIFILFWNELRIIKSISILSEKPIIKVFQWYFIIGLLSLFGYYYYDNQLINKLIQISHFVLNIFPYY
ncbi:MAG: hypothetical protein O3A55_06835 [Bacteroidetes bacterium]|nr:hypothetical protein [Bacteroidota bacterium]